MNLKFQDRSFVSAAFWNAVLMGASWLLGAATAVVVGRALGPTGKGEYTLATLVSTLLFTLFNIGIPASISYYVGGNRLPQNSLVKTVVIAAILLAAIGVSAAFLFDRTGWCKYLFGASRLSPAIWVAVFGLLPQFVGTFLQFTILAQGHRVLFAAMPALGQIAASLPLVALAVAGRLTVFNAVSSMVLSQFLAATILVVYEQHHVGWFRAPLMRWNGLKGLTRYAAVSHAGSTLQFLVQRIDVFMISTLLDLRAVGLYSVAYGLAELLLLLPQRFGVLYFPRIAAELSPATKAEEVRLSSSAVLLGTLVAAAFLALVGPFGIRLLYGGAFAPAVAPFFLLLPGACALAIASVQGAYLAGAGRIDTNTAVAGAGLLLNVLMNLVLIPRYGISGAAVASSVTYCAEAILLTRKVAHMTQAKPLAMLTSASPGTFVNLVRRALSPTVSPSR